MQALRGTSISWNVSASKDIRFVTALLSRENERRPIGAPYKADACLAPRLALNLLRVRFGEFELDEANALLLRGGSAIPLCTDTFRTAVRAGPPAGLTLTEARPARSGLGPQLCQRFVLKTAISDLRTVLVDDPRQPRYIETVARRGYRFIAVTTGLSVTAPPTASNSLLDEHARAPATRRRHRSSVARGARAPAVERGTAPVTASGPSSGSPASRASARPRSSSLSFPAIATSPARADTASSISAGANRISRCSRRSRSCAAVTTPRSPSSEVPWRRPGCCSCPGSGTWKIARACVASSQASARIACSAKWASCSIATPSTGHSCW